MNRRCFLGLLSGVAAQGVISRLAFLLFCGFSLFAQSPTLICDHYMQKTFEPGSAIAVFQNGVLLTNGIGYTQTGHEIFLLSWQTTDTFVYMYDRSINGQNLFTIDYAACSVPELLPPTTVVLTNNVGDPAVALQWTFTYNPLKIQSISYSAGTIVVDSGTALMCGQPVISAGTASLTCLVSASASSIFPPSPFTSGAVANIDVTLQTGTNDFTSLTLTGIIGVDASGSSTPVTLVLQ
jgi:hypothetical protein